ncbi:complement decay-accelerating factor-like isoform X7 [Rhinatrema bivittatum]|uniref:complement decay-accelerating factor-like isoform X7 n=1 Tax=Rhinatrema bivittatum TaxID=194408 RepID=UPI00112EA470|nr:complement decay-accelerating factor-like isoform X7 [Rhinatrema bivittatum]
MARRRKRTGERCPAATLCWLSCCCCCLLAGEVRGDCGIPPSITNALLKEEYAGREAFSAGSVVSYECDQATGYGKKPGMSDTITCLDNSTWSEIPTFCERTCNSPTRFFFAELQSEFTAMNLFPVGTTVSYDCRPGYRLTRGMPTSITCLQNLTWSVIAPFCERRSCGSPGELLNGGVDLDDNLFGSTAKFYCNPGYQIVGRSTRQCLSSGSWSNVVPTCDPVICGSPPNIEGGTHSGSEKEEFRYSSAVTYSCTSNELTLIGDASIYCTQYGNWSGNPPKCKVVSCTDPVVKNGRKISGFAPPYKYMFAVQFECNPGFTLSGDSLIKCDENSNWYPPVPTCQVATTTPSTTLTTDGRSTTESIQTVPGIGKGSTASSVQTVPGINGPGSNVDLIVGILAALFCLVVVGVAVYVYKRNKEGVYDTNESSKDVPLNPNITPTSQSLESDKIVQ